MAENSFEWISNKQAFEEIDKIIAKAESDKMKIFVLNETNAWNREPYLLGVFSSKENAIDAAKLDSKDTLSADDIHGLETGNQTQGRDVNYDISEINLDEKIN